MPKRKIDTCYYFVFNKIRVCSGCLRMEHYLSWIGNEYTREKMPAFCRNAYIVRDCVLNAHNSLRRRWRRCQEHLLNKVEIYHEKEEAFSYGKLTPMVLRKFLGSSGSSNGYAPTSITYKVTPHDQTSAIYQRQNQHD